MSRIERATFFDSLSTTNRGSRANDRLSEGDANRFHNALVERSKRSLDSESGEQRRRQRNENLQSLMVRVDKLSKELQEQLTWSAVLAYKEVIAEILQTVQDDLVEIETIVSRYGGEQRKRFVLIKNINNKTHEMVTHFLQKEREQLRVLELVGEINGLLFDLQS